MRIRQYAYFGLSSDVLSPEELTARVGLAPDEVLVKGSWMPSPPRPATNHWKLEAVSVGRVDEMLAELVDRVRPAAPAIKALVDDGNASATLQVVRYFDHPEGTEEELTTIETPTGEATKLPGQHQLLGFHLDADLVRFAAAHGIEIVVDEYG